MDETTLTDDEIVHGSEDDPLTITADADELAAPCPSRQRRGESQRAGALRDHASPLGEQPDRRRPPASRLDRTEP